MAMGTDPIADLLALQRDMDRVMERFGARTERPESDGRSFWMPTIDVYKQGDDMVVRAEVPGVSPNEISVSVTGNMLTVKGERRKDEQVQEGDWVLHESRYGSFERRVTLPEDIDASQVRAQYRAGILEVTVPRSALLTAQPRDVAVTGAPAAMGSAAQQASQPAYQQQPAQQGMQESSQQPYGQQQPATPASQQSMQQTESQPYGAGYGSQDTVAVGAPGEGGYQQQEQPANPQVRLEGGWVQPEQETKPAAEEEKRHSRLGGWLHGSGG